MKKYLMTGIAALVLSAGFTSCSHNDDFEPITQDQIDKAKYDQAFLAYVGGKIASNQDWGFSANPASSRVTRTISDYTNYKGSLEPSYDFPDDADASKFLADVPRGVDKLTQNVETANNWIDASWTGDINIWGNGNPGGDLYIKGNCDFSNRSFYFAGNSQLFLLEGATLTLSESGSGNLQQNTMIYIAEGAKLIAKGELKLNNGLHIYNHGTIEAPKLSTNSNSVLYNCGTVTVANKISVENELSVIVNDGTITAADLNTAGSGKFMNNDQVTISGTTLINSNDNAWVNNGHYHTGNYIYNAGSEEVINNCFLLVDADFNINMGDNPGNACFKMDAGSGVVTTYFNGGGPWAKNYSTGWSEGKGGPFKIVMGAGSVFKVIEDAQLNATAAATPISGYGFEVIGTEGYAVFQAKKVKNNGNPGHGYVAYSGNLYVSAEEHFAQGTAGASDGASYIAFKNGCSKENIFAPGFESGKPNINIAETPCNPGFEGYVPLEKAIRIIAEDLSASGDTDFDFNDIVLDVEFSATNAVLTLQAAGGTLPLRIDGKDEWEVHKLFGVDVDYMVNTNAKKLNRKGNLRDIEPITFSLGRAIKNAAEANGIKLEVYKNNVWQTLTAEKGEPACKLAVGLDFNWLDERTSIKDEYEKFVDWANGKEFVSKWWR